MIYKTFRDIFRMKYNNEFWLKNENDFKLLNKYFKCYKYLSREEYEKNNQNKKYIPSYGAFIPSESEMLDFINHDAGYETIIIKFEGLHLLIEKM